MNKILLTTVVGLGGGALFWFWPSHDAAAAPTPERDLYTVRRADLEISLTENGTMVAKESQKVTSKIKGESKILFLVEEGKQVEQDEVVCKIDPTQAQSQLEQVQLEILQTEANLKTARTELDIQTVENVATLTKAKTALDRAQKEIEKYRDGQAPQERSKLEVALKDAETAFNRAEKNLEDSKKLFEQNYIKKSEVEDHQIAYDRAVVQKKGAQSDLNMFDKYTFPMAITDLDTKLADAEREVSTAEKRGESTLGQKSVNVQQVEKRLKVQQQQLKERQEDLENMTLKAPCPGIVVYGNPHEPWYRDRVKVGGQIYGNFTVMTIPDLRVMQVKLQIHEADISKLKVGQKATVTTDSYPGLQLAGEVTKIASVASSNSDWGGQSEVKKFDVEVTLPAGDVQMRPGISAKVQIHIETREKALFVPLQSVFAEDGVHYCHVATGEGPARRKVQVGTSNDTYIEVLDGLADGEKVLLYNPSLPGTGSSPSDADTGGTKETEAKPGKEAAAAANSPGASPKSGS
ncbi:MAG TPA: efflux RND transporter periplasmic adaptor subunit [Planctomycetota bacterium]|nr:efflux RND transporter periplasmic adaptor subunit [Planctomycetota bacterium]